MSISVSTRITTKTKADIKRIVKQGCYINESAFIREAIKVLITLQDNAKDFIYLVPNSEEMKLLMDEQLPNLKRVIITSK